MARIARRKEHSECRSCGAFCDRLIHPASCLRAGCPSLYAYDDEAAGRRYMGCLHKVFGVEIDVELFEAAERTRAGYGAIKITGTATRRCQFTVEQAYPGTGEGFECVNRRFGDAPDAAPDAVRAFDPRDGI